MSQRVAFRVAAAIYLGMAVWLALAMALWPFVPERPFVVSKAILGILVAAMLAALGVWSLQMSRPDRPHTRLYTAMVAAPVVIFGALGGPVYIVPIAIPTIFAVWGAWRKAAIMKRGEV